MVRFLRTLLCAYGILWLSPSFAWGGALEEYVHKPDPSYAWSLFDKQSGLLARYYILHLTSQQWLDGNTVSKPLWTHELLVAQPRWFCGRTAQESSTAILLISGGNNRLDPFAKKQIPMEAGLVAYSFCRTVVEIRQVPNQPLFFTDENRMRKEDALLAYSLDRFLRGDPGDWPAHLAMVKAVVRAMDAIQEFSRSRDDMPPIKDFVLLGASKRGWTAWLTAAIDPRVRALVPASIDMPNLPQQFAHQFSAYGDYGRALADYKSFDIGCRMGSERGHELLQIIDPMAYRERLTMPKLVLNSAGDEFFVSDSSQFYFEKMPGDNRLRYTANTDHRQHGNNDDRVTFIQQARNWINDVLAGKTPPSLQWQYDGNHQLAVKPSVRPRRVLLWQADNEHTRDFRFETLGPVWYSSTLQPDANGIYHMSLPVPPKGWRASFVEVTFGGFFSSTQQVYTTPVFVLPESLPFASNGPCLSPNAIPSTVKN